MKFIDSVSGGSAQPWGLSLGLDGRHDLKIQPVSPTIIRVLLRKDGRCRLNRTWSIACGAPSVPWEGLGRDSLQFQTPFTTTENEEGFELSTDRLRVFIHRSPYRLQWWFKTQDSWQELAEERATGAVALGRRDHRLWHFHRLVPESRFFGLGEKSGEMNRRGRKFEMRNVDPMGYDSRTSDPLYKHFPFLIEERQGVHHGLFYDNLATCTIDLGQEIDNYHGPFTSYRAEDGDLDFYLILGPELIEVTRQFSWLTGQTYLPPRWSLGYSATSMTYTDTERAEERLMQFLADSERHQIPVKSFKFGSGYTSRGAKRYVFTWNKEKFPDPQRVTARFRKRGVRLCANIKPVLLVDHPEYERAADLGLFIKDSESGDQERSRFWDDIGSHLDFSNPDTIAWWQDQARRQLLDRGFDGLWNDNNEYVVWDDQARCQGFGQEIPIGLIRPLMSLWMTRASHEETQKSDPNRRVWSMSRCGCPGMQRYSQTWSGDNTTAWETLEYNTKMALGLSMSGVYNIGHDVGGFAGPVPDPEMLTRWFQIGAFHPRFGVNSWKADGTITEAWMYPEQLEAIRGAISLRMRFLPQLYSLLASSHRDHSPVLRPTFMNFPEDPLCYEYETELMWGDNLLIAPVTRASQIEREIYLPETPEGWWDFHSGRHHQGGQVVTLEAPLDRIPLLVRGGSFCLLACEGADSIDGPEEIRELHLFPAARPGNYQVLFYDDDGLSYDYQKGGYLDFTIQALQTESTVTLTLTSEGEYRPDYSELTVILPAGSELELAQPRLNIR